MAASGVTGKPVVRTFAGEHELFAALLDVEGV
jgi:hypothetical protein